jgi:putative transcriptional regulator
MRSSVIRWKLNELMAQQRKTNRDLAKFIGIHENSVYRLRKEDKMPRLNHDTLDKICEFLNCQPGDLLTWISSDELPQPETELR